MVTVETSAQNTGLISSAETTSFVTVHADGKSDVNVRITELGGDLVFDVSVAPGSNPNLSTLQALYFNIAALDLNENTTLKIEGASISRSGVIGDQAGFDLSNVNGHGGPYDAFVEFGANGVYSTTFTLSDSASSQPLRLNLLSGQAFGFRLDTPDDKITAVSSQPPVQQPAPDPTTPDGNGSEVTSSYDDLIEAGDGDDIIHGGRGNDEMQGEGGNDTIVGGTDYGRLAWGGGTLTQVTIGDNLYGNDGADTYFYAKGDGVDLIWDFRPDEDTVVLGYSSTEIIGATFVRGVTNRIETSSHDKIALILGKGATTHDAIVINDFGGLRDSTRASFVFADGKRMSMKEILALAENSPVPTTHQETWTGATGGSGRASGRASNSLDLFGSNGAEALIGRTGDDRLYGNEGFNQLNGNDGHDELYGGNARDVLIGGRGDDLGFGNGGADIIVGGIGSEKLYGGGGADIIYGDTDGLDDGKDIFNQGFDFRFNLGLEEKYRALFESAEPTAGSGVTAGSVVLTPGKNWWGGFEVTLTVTADASVGGWNLFLNSAYEITSIWGAELKKIQDGSTSALYELKNAPWNGSLAKGQTTTIGFTVRTPFDLVVEDKNLLLTGLKVGTDRTLDPGVAGAVGLINQELASMKEVTASESYTLAGSTKKLVAISGNKAIDLAGNEIGNTIIGNDGSNEIAGREGKDILTGKKGKDIFIFDTGLSKANLDTITDFDVKNDRFWLDNAIFKKLGSGTATKPKQLNKNFFSLDQAKDKNDHVIYNKTTGVLSYDADGSGEGQAVAFAKLKAGLELKFSYFYVI